MSASPAEPISPEDRLLLLCGRVELALHERQAVDRLIDAGIDWAEALQRAVRQGVPTLLHYHLRQSGLRAAVPPEIWDTLERTHQLATLVVMRQHHETGRLLDALQDEDVPVIPLKGVALREHVYPDPAMRPGGDIDLLVPLHAVTQAERALQQLGYVPDESVHPRSWFQPKTSHHLVPYRQPDRDVQVEIHWALAPPQAGLRIDAGGLWQRATTGSLAGRRVHSLAPEDFLLHLCLHGTLLSRSLTRLRHLVDIGETVRHCQGRLDWYRLADLAEEWGASRYLYLAIRLADELLGLECAGPIVANRQPAALDDATVDAARRRVLAIGRVHSPAWATDHMMALQLADSPQEKLRLLRQVLFPDRQRMAELYHLPPNSLRLAGCYLKRPFQLLRRHARHLRS